jgi:hypothetical protein
MRDQQSDQLAFGIEGMIHEAAVEAAPEWTGARCFSQRPTSHRPISMPPSAAYQKMIDAYKLKAIDIESSRPRLRLPPSDSGDPMRLSPEVDVGELLV